MEAKIGQSYPCRTAVQDPEHCIVGDDQVPDPTLPLTLPATFAT
jgi:hypothetical protein